MKFRKLFSLKTFSLRAKLIAGGMLILLLPVLVIGTFTFVKSYNASEDISKRQFVQIAQSLSGMIRIALEKDLRVVSGAAIEPVIVRSLLSRRSSLLAQEKLEELFKMLTVDYESLALFDSGGIIRANAAGREALGISIADRSYFKAASQGRAGVDTMVFSKATGDPIFGICAPVMTASGRFIGGVLGVVKADYLLRYIASIKLGATGYAFMIDRDGIAIAHPSRELILVDNINNHPDLDKLAAKMLGQEAGSEEYIFRGVKKIAGFSPVEFSGWSIAVTQDKDEIMALAYTNRNFILFISGIFIVITVVAVFFLSGSISTPVQNTLASLNQAIEQATEAFVMVGPDGIVRFVNPAMAAIMDSPRAELMGMPLDLRTKNRSDTENMWSTVLAGNVWSGRISGNNSEGIAYTMDLTVTPVKGKSGKISSYLGIGRDISKELMMQERIQQSQKMEAIGTLAGGIAHDFNNILTAVFGYTELAFKSTDNREKLEKYLTEIFNASKRARDLVNHILTFSRKTDIGQKVIIPKYIIKEALKLLRASIPSTIEIREKMISSAAIQGDPTLIHQMTMNLCTNAGYAMRERGGVLEVSLDEITVEEDFSAEHQEMAPGNYLKIMVSDTGTGIDPEIIERVFDPFFTTKPTGEGTGLGLSVVHGIVKSLDGLITVSSSPGKGTVFTVYLPEAEMQAIGADDSGLEDIPGGSERILFVDDEETIAESGKELLEYLGYNVVTFTESNLAWDVFSEKPELFDLVITDYTMPHMTGIELAKKIREIHRNIPIIICSGYFSLREKLDDLGNVGFVNKPLSTQELAEAVRRALDGNGKSRDS